MVDHGLIVSVLFTYLFKFSESRVISEDVLELSEDSETELVPGALGTTSCIALIIRLTIFFD